MMRVYYNYIKSLKKRVVMALQDKIKWDKKYQETPTLLENRNPSNKLTKIVSKTKGNKALEIACGAGRNSIYLAKVGFNVEALDISKIALNTLKKQGYTNIITKCIDLEDYHPTLDSYNLIIMTNYLDRNIIPHLANALTKDGILFIETYMDDKENEKRNSNPDFLLKPDELKTFFDENYEILEYDESFNESYELYRMKKQSIIVRKL